MNLFNKVLLKVCSYLAKKQQEEQKTQEDKDRERVIAELRQVYMFVRWLNTRCLKNRHERKAFWKRVNENEEQLTETISRIIVEYSKPYENNTSK